MLVEPVVEFALWFVAGTGVLLGVTALLTLQIPSRGSRGLGIASIACLATPPVVLFAIAGELPQWELLFFTGLLTVPGLIGIAFNSSFHDKPGHCPTCGYNLTGNVSGKCSECGAPVPAP